MSLTYLSFLAKRDSRAICFRDFLGGVYHAPFNIVGYGGTQLGLGLGLVRCIRVGGGNMHIFSYFVFEIMRSENGHGTVEPEIASYSTSNSLSAFSDLPRLLARN